MTFRFYLCVSLIGMGLLSHDVAVAADKHPEKEAEPVPLVDPIQKGKLVLGLNAGCGFAHEIANSATDHQFVALGGRVGRVLSGPRGPSFLKGNLEFSVEMLPVFLVHHDDTTYGASFTLLLRQYFSPKSRWRPFASLGAGMLVSLDKVPDATSRVNFTPQAGLGLAMAHSDRTIFTVEYRFHHISNADTAELNPGINSSSFHFGVSMFR